MYKTLGLTVCVTLFFSCPAAAQSSFVTYPSYHSFVLGMRTAGMGGTGTAFGRDSAMPWVNPAGVARVEKDNFSMSVNAYVVDTWNSDRFLLSGASGEEDRAGLGGTKTSIFPTSLSYVFRLDEEANHLLALSVLVPYQRIRDLHSALPVDVSETTVGKLTYMESFTIQQYEFGPTYSLKLGMVTLGLSAFFRYVPVEYRQFLERLSYTTAGDLSAFPYKTSIDAGSFDLDIVGGVQVGPFLGGFYAGAAVHSPSIHLLGHYDQQLRRYEGVSQETRIEVEFATVNEDSFEVKTPVWFSVGIGYQRKKSFAVAIDVSYHLPVSKYSNVSGVEQILMASTDPEVDSVFEARRVSLDSEQAGVFNVAAGGELYLTPRVVLRAGFFTDFSAVPGIPRRPGEEYLGRTVVDRFGTTLGVAYEGERGRFQATLAYLYGTGDTAITELTLTPEGVADLYFHRGAMESNTFMFMFSGRIDVATIFATAKAAVKEEMGILEAGE